MYWYFLCNPSKWCQTVTVGFPAGSGGEASACSAGDPGSIPQSGRCPGEGNGSPVQSSCLENPWTEEPRGLQSVGSQRLRRDWAADHRKRRGKDTSERKQVSKHKLSRSVLSDSLWPHGLHSPWNSPGQNAGVGSLSFSRGSSWPRNRTWVSCIAGRFFTSWAIREAWEIKTTLNIFNSALLSF